MRKIKIATVLEKLKHVADKPFLFAQAQMIWLGIVIVTHYFDLYYETAGNDGLSGLFTIATGIFMLPVIVNTHRYMLTGELPVLRFGPLELRYMLAAIVIALPLFVYLIVSVFAIMSIGGPIPEDGEPATGHIAAASVAVIFGLVLVFTIMVPMSLVLPARALGRNDFSFSDAMQAARNNIVRLAVMMIFITLFGLLLGYIGSALLFMSALTGSPFIILLVSGVFAGVLDFFLTILGAGLLSLIYAGLVEGVELFLD